MGVVLTQVYTKNPNMCFGCSKDNPIGLKLNFTYEDGVCRTSAVIGENYQGWNNVVHGGIIATMLDETMAQWLWLNDIPCMTAEMTTRFSLEVPVGEKITVEATCAGHRGRLYEMEGKVVLPDGRVAARARAKFLRVKAQKSGGCGQVQT